MKLKWGQRFAKCLTQAWFVVSALENRAILMIIRRKGIGVIPNMCICESGWLEVFSGGNETHVPFGFTQLTIPWEILIQCFSSLVAQTSKNLPAMQETWVWSLGWEDPLEEGMATHSCILAWRIPMDRGAWRALSMGSQSLRHDWSTKHTVLLL